MEEGKEEGGKGGRSLFVCYNASLCLLGTKQQKVMTQQPNGAQQTNNVTITRVCVCACTQKQRPHQLVLVYFCGWGVAVDAESAELSLLQPKCPFLEDALVSCVNVSWILPSKKQKEERERSEV